MDPKFVLSPAMAERAIELGWLRAEDVIVSHPVPAGPLLEAALGSVLKEWADTGYYPPRDAIFCAAVDTYTGDWCKTLASDCRASGGIGQHSYDGRDPWPTDTPNDEEH